MVRVKFDEKLKLWSSDDAPFVYNPNISIGHLLLRSMEMYESQIAQISDDTGKQFTFGEFRMMTIRAAQNLQKRGYDSKQVISIISTNIPQYLAPCLFASLCLGCAVHTMPTTPKREILRVLGMSEPKIVFCEISVFNLVQKCLTELQMNAKIFILNDTTDNAESIEELFIETGIEEEFEPVEVNGVNDISIILSTSGTTGQSKGVCLSHAALISEIDGTNVKMYANGVTLSVGSVDNIAGFLPFLLSPFGGTTRILTTEPFSIEMQFRMIEKYKLTVLENDSYELLLMLKSGLLSKTDLSSVKHMIVGGCKIPIAIRKEINSYLPNGNVHIDYGATELGGVSFDYPKFTEKDTVGQLVNGVTVKIVDDRGNRCGVNVEGEIYVKARFKFLGYYKNQQLTDEVLDSDGFFKTGDIGHIDEDGYLYVVDRKKHIIVGETGWVYPSDIEEVLLESPKIENVCVVGVQFDEIVEIPAAIVVGRNGSQITEVEISKMVEDNLADSFKLRGGIYFVDSIPISATGKPLRREVKEIVTNLYRARLNSKTL